MSKSTQLHDPLPRTTSITHVPTSEPRAPILQLDGSVATHAVGGWYDRASDAANRNGLAPCGKNQHLCWISHPKIIYSAEAPENHCKKFPLQEGDLPHGDRVRLLAPSCKPFLRMEITKKDRTVHSPSSKKPTPEDGIETPSSKRIKKKRKGLRKSTTSIAQDVTLPEANRNHKQHIHRGLMGNEEAVKKVHHSRQTLKDSHFPWATSNLHVIQKKVKMNGHQTRRSSTKQIQRFGPHRVLKEFFCWDIYRQLHQNICETAATHKRCQRHSNLPTKSVEQQGGKEPLRHPSPTN